MSPKIKIKITEPIIKAERTEHDESKTEVKENL